MDLTRPEFWVRPLTAAPERSVRAPDPLSQNERVKTKEFVTKYIAREQAAGKRPTKTGLEKEAKNSGRKGRRQNRRNELDKQMGKDAPGRGRPTK